MLALMVLMSVGLVGCNHGHHNHGEHHDEKHMSHHEDCGCGGDESKKSDCGCSEKKGECNCKEHKHGKDGEGCCGGCDKAKQLTKSEEAKISEKMANQTFYLPYTAEKMEELKGSQKFAVFFHASWCGTCINWENNLLSAADTLPANVKILKADYDTEKDLVKSLNVKSQSTLVYIDEKGEIVDTAMDPAIEEVTKFFSEKSAEKYSTKYEVFSSGKFNQLKGADKFVVMFYADWCGTCRAWEKSILSELDGLPENTKILKADFDTETALKDELEVKMQSTAVFFNADGTVEKSVMDPKSPELIAFFAS